MIDPVKKALGCLKALQAMKFKPVNDVLLASNQEQVLAAMMEVSRLVNDSSPMLDMLLSPREFEMPVVSPNGTDRLDLLVFCHFANNNVCCVKIEDFMSRNIYALLGSILGEGHSMSTIENIINGISQQLDILLGKGAYQMQMSNEAAVFVKS